MKHDGLSESRRQEQAIREFAKAMLAVEDVLEDINDAVWGLPTWAIEDIQVALSKYRLKVTNER